MAKTVKTKLREVADIIHGELFVHETCYIIEAYTSKRRGKIQFIFGLDGMINATKHKQ